VPCGPVVGVSRMRGATVNEAEAVNAQRDAHMVGGSVLERRMNWLEEKRRGWSPESGGWGGADRDAGRIAELERQRDAWTLALEQRDIALTIATLRGDAWHALATKAEMERDAARAEAADRPEYPVDLPDCFRVLEGYRERIADLGRQRDAAMELLAESRAEAARHAGRLIVACEERDVANQRGDDFWQAIVSHAAGRTLRGRIGSWLRAKAGR